MNYYNYASVYYFHKIILLKVHLFIIKLVSSKLNKLLLFTRILIFVNSKDIMHTFDELVATINEFHIILLST